MEEKIKEILEKHLFVNDIGKDAQVDGVNEAAKEIASLLRPSEVSEGEIREYFELFYPKSEDCSFSAQSAAIVAKQFFDKKALSLNMESLQEKEQRIRELEEENRWYLTKDKLPKEDVLVLGQLKKPFTENGKYAVNSWEKHTDQDDKWFKKVFVKWRYLPTPPTDNNQNDTTKPGNTLD